MFCLQCVRHGGLAKNVPAGMSFPLPNSRFVGGLSFHLNFRWLLRHGRQKAGAYWREQARTDHESVRFAYTGQLLRDRSKRGKILA